MCGVPVTLIQTTTDGLLSSSDQSVVVFPLHRPFIDGLVAYTHVNASDAASRVLLSRASHSLSKQFKLPVATENMHVFTYEHVMEEGTGRANSFQSVFANTNLGTFLIFLFERVQFPGPSGFTCGKVNVSLPSSSLATQSNTGQPGSWVFLVGATPSLCPAGAMSPPLCQDSCPVGRMGLDCVEECHCAAGMSCLTGTCPVGCAPGWTGERCDQDVNECASEVCGAHSECVNRRGSHECRCVKGYRMERGECVVDGCGECSPFAVCVPPRCECQKGFRGNGSYCENFEPKIGGYSSIVFLALPSFLCFFWIILLAAIVYLCTRYVYGDKLKDNVHRKNRDNLTTMSNVTRKPYRPGDSFR